MLFNAPIPGEVFEKEWEFPKEIKSSKHQQEKQNKPQALKLNLSPSTTVNKTENPEVVKCCFLPKP